MFQVQRFPSEKFTSNVYSIRHLTYPDIYLIDCGGFSKIRASLSTEQKIAGIFLTHYHYDHIYYLSQWISEFPDLMVWGSKQTLEGLLDAKRNLSYYHQDPIETAPSKLSILQDNEVVNLVENALSITAYETEGHCEGSLTFAIEHFLFTGDVLIPNIGTVTKLKTGNKEKAKRSIQKINKLGTSDSIICPGHLEMISYSQVNWSLYL